MNPPFFRWTFLSLFAIAFLSLSGCGGVSQSDMLKHARKKKSDEELAANVGEITPASPAAAASSTASSEAASDASGQNATQPANGVAAPSGPAASPAPTPAAAPATTGTPSPASASPAAPTEQKIVPDVPLPVVPQTVAEKRQRTINNLTAIGKGLERYREKNGCYPPAAVYNASGAPILSWRVLLLPYLGYDDLFKRFRLDDYWDGSANEALADEIPPCFQSPDRLDKKTNYVFVTGPGTAFADNQGPRSEAFRDGVTNTILVVEVDDSLATEWSRPQELVLNPPTPRQGLKQLRSDGFFALWGGGKVFRMPADAPDNLILAALSPAGGEPLVAALVGREANPEPDMNVKPYVPGAEVPAAGLAGDGLGSGQGSGLGSGAATDLGGAFPGGVASGGALTGGATGSGVYLPPPGSLGSLEVAAGDLFAKSKASLVAGKEVEALGYLYAAAITDSASTAAEGNPLGGENFAAPGWESDVKWIPALRKPALAVRWGVGVRYVAPNNLQKGPSPIGGETDALPSEEKTDPRKEVDYYSGEFGTKFIKELEARMTDGRMGNWLRDSAAEAASIGAVAPRSDDEEDEYLPRPRETASRRVRGASSGARDEEYRDRMQEERFLPGLLYFGAASDRVLMHLARRQQLEVLAVIDVEVRMLRTGAVSNDCYIELIDAESGKSLFRTPTLNNIKVEKERDDRTVAEDPVEAALNRLFEFVAANLDMAPVPGGLKAEHARKRVEALLAKKYDNPLPVLAEICYYRRRDLISEQDLAKAAIELLGESADRLLDGQTTAERSQALAEWLAEGQRRRQARLAP